jgi:hypothetical protein
VFTGADPPRKQVDGMSSQALEPSFEDRLTQLCPPPPTITAESSSILVASVSSLSTVLTQALNSSDEKLLHTCFQQSHSQESIHNTLIRLPPSLVPSLLSYFNSMLSRKQKRVPGIFNWIRQVIVTHGGYLVSQGDEVKQVLLRLRGTLERRGQSWERLIRLKGRLELLRAVKGEGNKNSGRVPEVTWIEEEEMMETVEEDVRYLSAGIDDDHVDEDRIEEVFDEMDYVQMENGVETEEIEEDDEEQTQVSKPPTKSSKKVNGIPHLSDSEDSALDLGDLSDGEVSEISEEGSDDEDEDEDTEIQHPYKSKSRR